MKAHQFGAVRDLFGVGKCHELAEFWGYSVRAGAGSLVAVRWVNGSPVGVVGLVDRSPVGR